MIDESAAKANEAPSQDDKSEPCKHKYWAWKWKSGIWTSERICTACGEVEKCGK